ncbi:MAG: hypothetical protein J7499_16480 [Sphingopyxis sp.]|nr:hypothetical protein [Sphingopyxis sp.]
METGASGQRFSGAVRLAPIMTRNIALSRPAMNAIAAFLALSAPVAFAQEIPSVTMTPPVATPPTPRTPPTVPEPSTTAPTAAPQTAQPPAPKPVIRVPLDIAPAETAPAPKAAEKAAPTRAGRATPRSAPKAAPAAIVAAPAAATPVTETDPVAEVAPIAAPVMAPAEPAPLPAAKAATGADFPWELAGGAAALLIAGGLSLAFARRGRAAREDYVDGAYEPVAATDPVATAPFAAPIADEAPAWVTPAYAPRERAEAPGASPAFAVAPNGSMGRHEALAMTGPTPGNPFATLSKRLKRARFLDRQERAAYDEALGAQKDMTRKPVSAWEIAQRDIAPPTTEQEILRPEPGSTRPGALRPGFVRH